MFKKYSGWTTVLWLFPYFCGIMRANVWPADSDYQWSLGALLFVGATAAMSELLARWYRMSIITEVRRSRDASMENRENAA